MATGAESGRWAEVVVLVPVVFHRWATASLAACFASRETKRRKTWDGLDGGAVTVTVTADAADGMNFVTIEASQTYSFTLPFVNVLGDITVAGNTRVPLVDE